MREKFGGLGHAHVKNIHTRGLQTHRRRLIRHGQQIVHHIQRVGAQLHVREVCLHNEFGVQGIAHIDTGKILRRRLVCKPQNPSAFGVELHGNAFPKTAKACQLVVGQKLHIERQRLISARTGRIECGHGI